MVLFLLSPDWFENFSQLFQIRGDFLHHFRYFEDPIPIQLMPVYVSIALKKLLLEMQKMEKKKCGI